MVGLFALLFLISLVLLPIGLFKPSILSLLRIPNPTRKKALAIFGGALLASFLLVGATAPPSIKDTSQVAGTAITQIPSETPVPSPTTEPSVTPVPVNLELVTVKRVVDGDTISLENGKVVRYIGIDTPETVDPRKPVQCYAKEASARNKELVEGQSVGLEKDVSETDKYGRLLRYVYKGDVLINELLVREGYAHSSSYPPDIKYQEKFRLAQQEAMENKRGLWGEACAVSPTLVQSAPSPTKAQTGGTQGQQSQTQAGSQTQKSAGTGSYTCDCNKTCPNMSCAEAQYQLSVCKCSARDNDGDGVACDVQCQ